MQTVYIRYIYVGMSTDTVKTCILECTPVDKRDFIRFSQAKERQHEWVHISAENVDRLDVTKVVRRLPYCRVFICADTNGPRVEVYVPKRTNFGFWDIVISCAWILTLALFLAWRYDIDGVLYDQWADVLRK